MVEISAAMVKELREKTGAAMMDCKQALVEANGDFEKASEILRQKGINVANKKSVRQALEGLVTGQIAADGQSAVLMEINCETDFVARNEEFVTLTRRLCEVALAASTTDVEQLLKTQVDGTTVENLITQTVAKTGENIVVRRLFFKKSQNKNGAFGLYVHSQGGKIGALVQCETSVPVADNSFARALAMHVVFAKPQFVSRADVPAEVVENEKRIESGKADLADKKPEIREKIVSGRVDKIFEKCCLLEQPFVRDESMSINKYIQEQSKELKADIKIVDFALLILGESSESSNGKDN